MTCVLDFGVASSNFTSCGEDFATRYKIYSVCLGSLFGLIMLASMISFANRMIECNMKLKWRDPAVRINILSIASSILGVFQFSNLEGVRWDFSCQTDRILTDLTTSLLYLIVFEIMRTTEVGFLIEGKGSENSTLFKNLSRFFQVVVLLNGIIPDVMYCNSTDNISKNNWLAAIYVIFSLFGSIFVFYRLFTIVILLRKKVKQKSNPSIKPSSIESIASQQKEEEKNILSMYRKFIVYNFLVFFTFAFQIYIGLHKINSTEPPTTYTEDSIFNFVNNVFVYLQLVILFITTFNNKKKFPTILIPFKLEYALGYFLASGTFFIILAAMLFLIFSDYVVYIAFSIFIFGLSIGSALGLASSGIMSRDEELSSCINYIGGRVMRLRNVIFMFIEVATLSFVSLDALFLWWAPPFWKDLAFVLFNGVSSSNSDYLEYVLPHVSSTIITNSIFAYIFVLVTMMSSSALFRFPKPFLRFLNFLSYLTYDIFIMTISSLLLRRMKCHNPSQGSDKAYDSLVGTGYLIGYNEINCDTNDLNYISFYGFLMIIMAFLVSWGLCYNLLVRNKTSAPNVWDIPGFSALKMLLKFIMICAVNLTPKDYFLSPWIRATVNLFCVMSITLASYVMMPCLGPQAEFVNLYRTSAYSFAAFCSLISFISLILLYTCGLENEVAGNVMGILTIVVPFLGSLMVFLLSKQRKHKKLEAIKKVCALATSNEATIEGLLKDYEESINSYGKEGNPFNFLPALALHYSSDSLVVISSALKLRLESFIALTTFDQNFFYLNGIPTAFSFLEKGSQYPEGSQVIKRKFLSLLVDCLMISEKYYSSIDLDSIENDKLVRESGPLSQVEAVIMPLLDIILAPLCQCLISICKRSKFYVQELLISFPLIFPLVLKLRNFSVFVVENGYYDTVKEHNNKVLLASITILEELLNIFKIHKNSLVKTNLMISLFVRGNFNGEDKTLTDTLKKDMGILNSTINQYNLVNKQLVNNDNNNNTQKIVNNKNLDEKDNVVSSTSLTASLMQKMSRKITFGTNGLASTKGFGGKKMEMENMFVLYDKKIFDTSKLENDAVVILKINQGEITKDSIIELVNEVFGKIKNDRGSRRISQSLRRLTGLISNDRKLSKRNSFMGDILKNEWKRRNDRTLVVVGIFSRGLFNANDENIIKEEFMKEWLRKDNYLQFTIEIILDIKFSIKNNEKKDNSKVKTSILKKDINEDERSSKLLQETKEYAKDLTVIVDRIIQERNRQKELWVVHGIDL